VPLWRLVISSVSSLQNAVEQEEALGGLVTKDGRRAKLGQLTSEGLSVLDDLDSLTPRLRL
jgi:hypothetical protein